MSWLAILGIIAAVIVLLVIFGALGLLEIFFDIVFGIIGAIGGDDSSGGSSSGGGFGGGSSGGGGASSDF